MANINTLTAEEHIINHLNDNGQKLSWLAEKIEVSDGHLHSVLKGKGLIKRDLTPDNLDKINSALGTSFRL